MQIQIFFEDSRQISSQGCFPDSRRRELNNFKISEEDEESNIASTLSFAWHPSEESIIMAIGRNGRLAECHVPGNIITLHYVTFSTKRRFQRHLDQTLNFSPTGYF